MTANHATRVYCAANPAFFASYSGFVLGEGPGVLGSTLTFSTSAMLTSGVGTYSIVPSGLTAANYGVAYVAGTLMVTQDSSTTAIVSSANPAAPCQPVTFTA